MRPADILLLSLARYDGRARTLPEFCASKEWAAVYLDEVSAVFVRRTEQNAALIARGNYPLTVGMIAATLDCR